MIVIIQFFNEVFYIKNNQNIAITLQIIFLIKAIFIKI
jgi:hypothetical protein